MGAVKLSEKIDMCINMEIWDATKVYDRMGIDSEYTEILGIRVPVMTIPVKPGRNLAVIDVYKRQPLSQRNCLSGLERGKKGIQ